MPSLSNVTEISTALGSDKQQLPVSSLFLLPTTHGDHQYVPAMPHAMLSHPYIVPWTFTWVWAVRPNPQPTDLNYILYLSPILHSNPRNSIVLVGDFNLPAVKWDSLTATSSACRNFCDFIFDNDFLQINDKPTHTGGNILDLIITNSDDCVRNLAIHSSGHLVISDHFTLTFQLSTPQPSYSCYVPMLNYDYPEADYNGLCSYLLLRLLSMSSVARC